MYRQAAKVIIANSLWASATALAADKVAQLARIGASSPTRMQKDNHIASAEIVETTPQKNSCPF